MKDCLAGRADYPAGDPKQPPLEGRKRPRRGSRQSDRLTEAGKVMGHGGKLGPGRVGTEVAGGKVSQSSGLQIPDRELHHRMLTVFALNQVKRFGTVGDEGVVSPAGQKLLLVG